MKQKWASKSNIIEVARHATLAVASIIFVCVYIPLTLQGCDQTVNNVPNYIPNATCFCQNNIGNSQPIGTLIVQNTSWYSQFTYNTNMNSYTIVGDVYVITILAQMPLVYLKYYYGIENSNTLTHLKSFNMFYTPDNSDILTTTIEHSGVYTGCNIVVSKGTNIVTVYANTSADNCTSFMQEYIPGFDPVVTIDYTTNLVYQSTCNLAYCQVQYCPANQQVTMIFFCITVISAIYTALRVLKQLIKWLAKADKIVQVSPLTVPLTLITPV